LKEKKTRQQVRELEYSELTKQLSPDGGYRDPIEMALEKTDWILKNHQPEPLDDSQKEALTQILAAADHEFS
jgi:hypothetical protein